MFLDAVNQSGSYPSGLQPLVDEVFEKWRDFPVSKISHHGTRCCETAREWLFSMDFSHLNGESLLTGPRWIRQRYDWGPTLWNIYWCEAVRQNALDCGAQAALAQEVFSARGVRSFQAQLVQRFSIEATRQWAHRWNAAQTSIHWINDELIYHEGCAVIVGGGEIKLWDASAGWWINPIDSGGYGSLAAIRFFASNNDSKTFRWKNQPVTPNEWQRIDRCLEKTP